MLRWRRRRLPSFLVVQGERQRGVIVVDPHVVIVNVFFGVNGGGSLVSPGIVAAEEAEVVGIRLKAGRE